MEDRPYMSAAYDDDDDPFDVERMRRDYAALEVQQVARRDRALAMLRRLWDTFPADRQTAMMAALDVALTASLALSDATWGMLSFDGVEPAVSTAKDIYDPTGDTGPNDPGWRVLSQWGSGWKLADLLSGRGRADRSTPVFSITEVLCAMSCWQAGEEYIPFVPCYRHPRWPARAVEHFERLWNSTPPAPPLDE